MLWLAGVTMLWLAGGHNAVAGWGSQCCGWLGVTMLWLAGGHNAVAGWLGVTVLWLGVDSKFDLQLLSV